MNSIIWIASSRWQAWIAARKNVSDRSCWFLRAPAPRPGAHRPSRRRAQGRRRTHSGRPLSPERACVPCCKRKRLIEAAGPFDCIGDSGNRLRERRLILDTQVKSVQPRGTDSCHRDGSDRSNVALASHPKRTDPQLPNLITGVRACDLLLQHTARRREILLGLVSPRFIG